MSPLDSNPFAVLTFLVAPAILTNASSVLSLSTSNRLARASDRARALSEELRKLPVGASAEAKRLDENFHRAWLRAQLLVKALRLFYLAIGSFGAGTCISLAGAAAGYMELRWLVEATVVAGAFAAVVGVTSLVFGALRLVSETRLALESIASEEEVIEQWKSRGVGKSGTSAV